MNGRNAPLSPVSVGGSEWSYPTIDTDSPLPNNRGQITTPPDSAGSAKAMNGSFPPGPRSVGGPSPPPSVGRSSSGTNLYARSESGRSQSQSENQELVLAEHYVSLKRYLSATSRDGNPKPPPNKARDKLQRLTGVQFLELSTDVYDELKRREQAARRPPNAPPGTGPPDYLLPEENFHPKRNQARQKLSSLGPPRFRDLATDVFCELERRYPRFAGPDVPRVGSPMSIRGSPGGRSQTPLSGMSGMSGFPPRGQSRRRPSEASSIRSARNGPPPPINGGFGVPPSPSLPPNAEYGRPMPKQFQSNTIVPNKSTMVEEDDDAATLMSPTNDESDPYGLGRISTDQESKRSEGPAEADKKLVEDYEQQMKELQEKLDTMEDAMRKKDEELAGILDKERSRENAASAEKEEWDEMRLTLETKLAQAQELNDSLERELERVRVEHESETRLLQEQLDESREATRQASLSASRNSNAPPNQELERENQELRIALQEQQEVTEEVRREAQEFLREMRMLSQQSGASWERQTELEQTIESLEKEVRDWRNRYARTKTQLRNMRASSMGLTIDQDAGKYVREKGFTEENGLVKDVHVTKFQIAIDELLQRARVDNPEQVIDSMKAVVVSVRRITKDIDAAPRSEEVKQQQAKLKSRVSSTANNLITASKNFASAAGISPVSLLDAAASHLVAAVVELLRTVKIRSTPAGELEDDDDGTITPVDSTGFFSPNSKHQSINSTATSTAKVSLPPPPPFQGLGGIRASLDSSSYSPINSPRESYSNQAYSNGMANGNGADYMNNQPRPLNGGYGMRQPDTRTEDLKNFLEGQTDTLVATIQNLVQLIRNDGNINQITDEINAISDVVGQVVRQTESAAGPNGSDDVRQLATCRERLLEAGKHGMDLAAEGKETADREWRMWTQTLPPIAFEIARETKELVQRVDQLVMNDGADDFS